MNILTFQTEQEAEKTLESYIKHNNVVAETYEALFEKDNDDADFEEEVENYLKVTSVYFVAECGAFSDNTYFFQAAAYPFFGIGENTDSLDELVASLKAAASGRLTSFRKTELILYTINDHDQRNKDAQELYQFSASDKEELKTDLGQEPALSILDVEGVNSLIDLITSKPPLSRGLTTSEIEQFEKLYNN